MMAEWINTIIQGVLLGGLYALFAAGLSLIFGIMRLVNLAHGDLIVLAAFVILAVSAWLGLDPFLATLFAMPIMFVFGFALQHVLLNRTLGRDLLPPLLVTFGLSIMIQNGLLEAFSADSQLLRSGSIGTASISLGGGVAFGVLPLITFASAVAVILALNLLFYRTPLGRAFRATSDDLEIAQLMGIDHDACLRAGDGDRHDRRDHRRALSRHARQFRSDHRAGAAALCLRGGDHRRARQLVGHACRRHDHRPRADHRRGDQSGMADPGRSHRVPDRARARPRGLFPRAFD